MDLTSLQIEGITRSKFNLDNYDFSTKKVAGNLSRISEPTEAIESDPQDNEKTPFSLDE